ncbi:hypothetical protein EVAR_45749_1 [Eumeta japonica]|uniref:Uncharacterized protein n=1 Tax=Eumeta variegata TaxID=151549 RepID=A0A4C1YS08_EUMVA|nr:hypothetical protein EVAR_45749_1 [Eumeta japonica]
MNYRPERYLFIRKSAQGKDSIRIYVNSGRFPVGSPSAATPLDCRMLFDLAACLSRFTRGRAEVSVVRGLRGAARPRRLWFINRLAIRMFQNQLPSPHARLSVGASYHARARRSLTRRRRCPPETESLELLFREITALSTEQLAFGRRLSSDVVGAPD